MQYKLLKVRGALQNSGSEPTASAPASRGVEPRPASDLLRRPIPPAILELVPASVAKERCVIPLAFDGETVTLAAQDPSDIALADSLRFTLAKNVRLVPASAKAILQAIERNYGPVLAEAYSCDSCLMEYEDSAEQVISQPAVKNRRREHLVEAALAPSRRSLGAAREPLASGRGVRASSHRKNLDETPNVGGTGMFFYIVEEGQRVLMRRPDGTMEVIVGPKRVWRGWNRFQKMSHHVAHPGDYLIVQGRDGSQEHLPGPVEVWFDPRQHQSIEVEESLQLAAKEAVVVYSRPSTSEKIGRRIVYGPALFVPAPGEWLHTFSWHGAKKGAPSAEKVADGLVFQKLWLMPDQMYHDVVDVRTADDAVLTVRLMIFFELLDIERMLDSTHDPIGDFVNAATSDVVDFLGKHDFDSFKRHTDKLNELAAYKQLTNRAEQCGYRINKVVYRGYGAPASLQQMHDQAIEARTRLQLDRATETQTQELEDYRLGCQLARSAKRRAEQTQEVEHDLELAGRRHRAEIEQQKTRREFLREQQQRDAEVQQKTARDEDSRQQDRLAALRTLGVDLTAYLTQARADQVIEMRGAAGTHVHLSAKRKEQAPTAPAALAPPSGLSEEA